MCNLLIPLCPFVLHSTTTTTTNHETGCCSSSNDAKILYAYMSKRPYKHSSSSPSSSSNPIPQPPSVKAAKLYKRAEWHTCSCVFSRVSVLHPLPGPSRPVFGSGYRICTRCSVAAKPLRPQRRGGPTDFWTRTDPFYNRTVFPGASGVFERGGTTGSENASSRRNVGRDSDSSAHKGHGHVAVDQSEECYYRGEIPAPTGEYQARRTPEESYSAKSEPSRPIGRYQADLDAYLLCTYGPKS